MTNCDSLCVCVCERDHRFLVIAVKITRVDCADSFEQVVLLGLGFRVEGLGVMVVDVEQVDFHLIGWVWARVDWHWTKIA